MNFDKWFNSQSTLVKVILLIIPFVGWVVELLVRACVLARKKDTMSIIALIVFVVFGGFWVLCVADLIYLVLKGHLFLAD